MISAETEVDAEISILLERKMRSLEKDMGPAIPVLNHFIESELTELEKLVPVKADLSRNIDRLNEIFTSQIL